MICPACGSEAVVAVPMRNAPEVAVMTCVVCGMRWSEARCETRNCREPAVVRCILDECRKFRCRGHGAGKSGQCQACVRRTARLVKPAGRGRWWTS